LVTLSFTNSGSLSNPSSRTYSSMLASATTYSIVGPTGGILNQVSSNFTISLNGSYNGTITITPTGGGLTLPITLTFINSTTPQTFNITPTVVGIVNFVVTNSGSLTGPTTGSYTVTAPVAPINTGTFGATSNGTYNPSLSNQRFIQNTSSNLPYQRGSHQIIDVNTDLHPTPKNPSSALFFEGHSQNWYYES